MRELPGPPVSHVRSARSSSPAPVALAWRHAWCSGGPRRIVGRLAGQEPPGTQHVPELVLNRPSGASGQPFPVAGVQACAEREQRPGRPPRRGGAIHAACGGDGNRNSRAGRPGLARPAACQPAWCRRTRRFWHRQLFAWLIRRLRHDAATRSWRPALAEGGGAAERRPEQQADLHRVERQERRGRLHVVLELGDGQRARLHREPLPPVD